jgi:diguanylate cyclase (GGDEF)-like protein
LASLKNVRIAIPRVIARRGPLATLRASGAARVWVLAIALAVSGAVLGVLLVPADPPVQPPALIPWWLLAAAFYLAEAKVVHIHIGQSAHSFSMSEVPLVIGLFLVQPAGFIAARVLGSGVALVLHRKQRSVKLAFNLALFLIGGVAAVSVVHLAAPTETSFGPRLWVAGLAATGLENLIGVLAVVTAISVAEGTPQYRRIPEMIRIGTLVSLTNASLAMTAVIVFWLEPRAALLFVVPLATAAVAYRAYITERRQHEQLEMLYESTRILQRNPEMASALVTLLEHARRMFRADRVEIYMLPQREGDDVLRTAVGPGDQTIVMEPIGPAIDDPLLLRAVMERMAFIGEWDAPAGAGDGEPHGGRAMVAPLNGETSLIGAMVAANRLSDLNPFDDNDLRFFETLVNHTAVALENGQLEQSLLKLSEMKDELRHQAFHDALTGLANRSLFGQIVAQRLEAPDPSGLIPVVLFLDLDDFKFVNDTLGHAAGDALLISVGERIRANLRPEDVAARLGGDEFAILISDGPDLTTALRIGQRLTAEMSSDFEVAGRPVTVRASVGVAAGRPGVGTAGDLLRDADVAMYSAKAQGKGRLVIFEPAMHAAVVTRANLQTDLERAIESDELLLEYQPIFEIGTGRTIAVEALVRWDHPERGRLWPAGFIGVAEESDTIIKLGRWVLEAACRDARRWQDEQPGSEVTVSVNVSARQLSQADFAEGVLEVIRASGVRPQGIALEVTETATLQDYEATRAKLQVLREAGVGIWVDDFGTGYSSLSYLRRLPVTALKIAGDFVDVDESDTDAWTLASAIVALGRALDLTVIAEGVEHRWQLDRLVELGCRNVQGYLFARPVAPGAIPEIVRTGSRCATEAGTTAAEVGAEGAAIIRLHGRRTA